MSTKIEFAVQMTCDSCVKAVEKSLKGVAGIESVDINLKSGSVVVQTTLSTSDVLKQLQLSGRKAVVKGLAGSLAGVVILDTGSPNIKGVVRFVQVDSDTCVIDGTIDGLQPGKYGLFVHESGDISEGCESLGGCYIKEHSGPNARQYGYLGAISAASDGRATFKIQDDVIKLQDIIGRSLVVTEQSGDATGNAGKRLVCGIIARSSGLFQNPKTICACDGISIWDERNIPNSPM